MIPIEKGQFDVVFIWNFSFPSMKFCMFFTFEAPVGIPIPNQLPGLAVNDKTLLPSYAVVVAAVRLLHTSIDGLAPSDPVTGVFSV